MLLNRVPDYLSQKLSDTIRGERLIPLFQPLVSLHEQRIIAYETSWQLPPESPFGCFFLLREAAKATGHLPELEASCAKCAILAAAAIDLRPKLLLETSPQAILDSPFSPETLPKFLEPLGFPSDSLVLVIGESIPQELLPKLSAAAQRLQILGTQIALNRIGTGLTDLRLWAELRPDFVKLDPYFLEKNSLRQSKKILSMPSVMSLCV